MTKEELIVEAVKCANNMQEVSIEILLNKFFEQNVVVQKGENRHKDADVIHKWAEGTEVQYREIQGNMNWENAILTSRYEYRIKPKEPVYEWQWVYGLRGIDSRGAHISPHLTEDEFKQYLNDRNSAYDYEDYFYYAIEETKRERK